MGCSGDTQAQASGDAEVQEGTPKSIDTRAASASVETIAQVGTVLPDTPRVDPVPKEVMAPKGVNQVQVDSYLSSQVQDQDVANQIKDYLKNDQKVSAVRVVNKMAGLDLPEAKAFVDTLEVLMGTSKTKRVKVDRKKYK